MWEEALINYLLFLLEAVTVVGAILIILGSLVTLGAKNKTKQGQLLVRPIHKRYKKYQSKLQHSISTAYELKKLAKQEKQQEKKQAKNNKQQNSNHKRLFVINFHGDVMAGQVESLREEITAILEVASKQDEVLVKVESGGGAVHGYGLAASQLERVKKNDIPLTVAVDKIAASGGYMMASVADKILCAPFAIVGSIGVVAQIPNFNRLLENHGVDIELHTAGQYKRTLTTLGENTEEAREKFKQDLEVVHNLFQSHIEKHRKLDMNKVATGEYWFGYDAYQLNLIDELSTSDDYLHHCYKQNQQSIYEVEYKIKKGRFQQLKASMQKALMWNANFDRI